MARSAEKIKDWVKFLAETLEYMGQNNDDTWDQGFMLEAIEKDLFILAADTNEDPKHLEELRDNPIS